MRLFILLLIAPLLTCAADLSVSIDFPGGSGQVLELDQEKRLITLNPTVHKDRGWACWWYIKVTGVTPGETLTVDVGKDSWATPTQAVFSTDNKTWTQTAPGKRRRGRITYVQKVDAVECWFAWGPPFVPSHAQALVDQAAARGAFATAFELCKTRAGRSVPALVVKEGDLPDDERSGIWIQARQHAWEAGSSWVCKGIVDWLTSDHPGAAKLRQSSIIYVVPIMDIDNVAIGAGGKTQKPQDHNRDWSDEPYWHSVRAATTKIKEMDAAGGLAIFMDLHNPGANSKYPFYYAPPGDLQSKTAKDNQKRFIAASLEEMSGPLTYKGEVKISGRNYDRKWRRISKNWIVENTSSDAVSLTLETAWNTPDSNAAGYQTNGRQLGRAMARYFGLMVGD
jgi:hypothetical protein